MILQAALHLVVHQAVRLLHQAHLLAVLLAPLRVVVLLVHPLAAPRVHLRAVLLVHLLVALQAVRPAPLAVVHPAAPLRAVLPLVVHQVLLVQVPQQALRAAAHLQVLLTKIHQLRRNMLLQPTKI